MEFIDFALDNWQVFFIIVCALGLLVFAYELWIERIDEKDEHETHAGY